MVRATAQTALLQAQVIQLLKFTLDIPGKDTAQQHTAATAGRSPQANRTAGLPSLQRPSEDTDSKPPPS